MSILILIIVDPILYMVLGTVFGILLTLLNTGNLKLKIGLLTLMRPVLYTFLLSILLPSLFYGSLVWFAGSVLAIVLRDVIFSNAKFLVNLNVHNDSISIEYVNTFFTKKNIEISFDLAKVLKLSNMKSIVDYPTSLKIGDSNNLQKFIVLDRKVWKLTNTNLNAAYQFLQ